MQVSSQENDTPVNSFLTNDETADYFSQSATVS